MVFGFGKKKKKAEAEAAKPAAAIGPDGKGERVAMVIVNLIIPNKPQ